VVATPREITHLKAQTARRDASAHVLHSPASCRMFRTTDKKQEKVFAFTKF
jgi:hypothetical protein